MFTSFARGRVVAAMAVAAAICAGVPAAMAVEAPPPEATGTFAIAIRGDGVPGWQVEALARALADDLKDRRLQPAEGGAPADIVLGGVIEGERWRYEMAMTWPDAEPALLRGTIELHGLGRRGLVDAVKTALEPVLRAGGGLDRRDSPIIEEPAARLPAPDGGGLAAALLAAIGVWLALPFLYGVLIARVRVGRLRSFRRVLLGWLGLAAAAVALVAAGDRVPEASWAILIAGGLAWGWFAAAILPHALPPLHGMARVEYLDLIRMLGAWSLFAAQRLVRTAFLLLPVALAVWAMALILDQPALVAVGVAAPVAGHLTRLWVRSWVEVLALRLDAQLVEGGGGEDDPWHVAVRGYFRGYVRRAGWPASEHLLDNIRFLPGAGEEVHLYGGGLTHSRIVVGRQLLEFALAPYGRPHDYAAPRVSKLHWTEWNAGLVVPIEVGTPMATREQRQPRPVAVEGEHEYQPFGEVPTLAGIVEPYKLDLRTAHRPWEDPLWLDWDPGEEDDGTDASDKDFLFGLLVWQLGRIQRHEDRAATIGLALRRWIAARPRLDRLAARVLGPPRAILGRQPAVIADAYAALNFARHHLVQYLAWVAWRREDLLTARAYPAVLERESNDIVRALASEQRGEPRFAGATPRNRLMWMSAFLDERLRSRSARVWQRAAIAGVLIGGLAAAAAAVVQAIDYHPTWIERMNEQRERLERQPDHGQETR